MASQALYRKWRSQTFGDLIGQEAVVQTLKNALQSGRIAHAYLFCGPRGTGKTSAARLLAKTVNCQNPQNGEPCNECLNCREITENRSMDVIEIDAASNRGIDEIRDLRAKVGFNPGTGKYKVYVLDEAHMLTTDAWNALLKTLEEPPPHVIFVLATTEAHRILPTILSRCQRLDFKRFSVRDTIKRLQQVAEGESLHLEPGAADLIARAAGGGMRDALSLLDQALASMGETITMTGVQQMLGIADPRLVRQLIEHIAAQRGADGLHLINRLAEAGADLRQLSAQVAEYWRALMLSKAGADVVAVLERSPEEAAEIAELAEAFALDELSACARLFSQNDVGARSLSIPQLAVELAFIDCLHLHRQRVNGVSPVSARPGNSAAAPTSRSGSAPGPRWGATFAAVETPPPAPAQQSAPAVSPPLPERQVREAPSTPAYEAAEEVEELDLAEAIPEEMQAPLSAEPHAGVGDEASEEERSATPPVVHSGLDIRFVTGQWEMIKKACKTKSPKLAALLNHAHPVAISGEDGTDVVIQVEYEFHYKKLLEPGSRSIVEWALQEILDQPCRARFIQKDDPVPPSTLPDALPQAAPRSAPAPETRRPSANGAAPAVPPPPAQMVPDNQSAPPAAPQAPRELKYLLEEKIRRDPLVEEIIRTYDAHLVDWEPLDK
jgi:DNA polymerase-3 subunit gamma/tau